MSTYAIIDTSHNTVVNVVEWDGVPYTPAVPSEPATDDTPATEGTPATGWSPPDGQIAVLLPEGSEAGIGWSYSNGGFAAPPPPPPPVRTPEEILATNISKRNQLLAAATLAIAPLQDADDLGEATTEETAMLKAWKQFRVAVNRVDLTQTDPSWPQAPQPGYGADMANPSA